MSPPLFEVLAPEVTRRSERHYAHLDADRREELVQRSLCFAWQLYDSAIRRGNHRFTPCTLALFANMAVDEGRRFAGYKKSDALDHGAVGFDDLDAEGRSRIAEALVQRQTPVFDQARIAIDWPAFLHDDLTERERDVVTKVAEGWKRVEVAKYLGLSPARITQLLACVADAYVAYLGVPGFEYRARRQEKRKPARKSKKPRAAA